MIRRLTTFSIIYNLGSLGIAVLALLYVFFIDRQQAEQALNNSALVIERELNEQMLAWDFLLQKYLTLTARSAVPNGKIESWQNGRAPGFLASDGDMGSFMISDTQGNVVNASPPLVPHDFDLAGLDCFLVHKQRTEVGLYFSQPFDNSLRSGNRSIAISRRLPSEDGTFRGVALGILPLTRFEHVLRNIELGPQGSVTVSTLAGGHLFSTSDVRIVSVDDLAAKAPIRESPVTVVVADGPEGMNRLHTLRRIGELPLLLDVAVSINGIPKAGRIAAITVGFILIVLCCLNLVLCRLLRREHAQRLRREEQLITITCERFAHEKSSRPRQNAKLP